MRNFTDAEWNAHYKRVTESTTYRKLRRLELTLACIEEQKLKIREEQERLAELEDGAREVLPALLNELSEAVPGLPEKIKTYKGVITLRADWSEHRDILDAVYLEPEPKHLDMFDLAEKLLPADDKDALPIAADEAA